jgi:hypothetical protein
MLAPAGDRRDAEVRVIGPGDTDYTFPLSVTRTVQTMWRIADSDLPGAIEELSRGIFSIRGTASAPPADGYWFDSYNSENSIAETLNKIRNLGETLVLKNRTVSDEIAAIFGGGLVLALEEASQQFLELSGMPLIGSLDYAFERSEADSDLGSAPFSKPEYLYRICILSVMIDAFKLRLPTEARDTPSLRALKNWLADRVDAARVIELTATFARIKDLRKQYPIHEHFQSDPTGQKVVRDEVREAEDYFGFAPSDDYPAKWKKVTDAFQAAISELKGVVTVE